MGCLSNSGRKESGSCIPTITIALHNGVVDIVSSFAGLKVDTQRLRRLIRESRRIFHGRQIAYDSDDSESIYSAFSVSPDSVESDDSMGVFAKFDFSDFIMERPDEDHFNLIYDPADFISMADDGSLHLSFSRFPESPRSTNCNHTQSSSALTEFVENEKQQWHHSTALQPVMSMVNAVEKMVGAGYRILGSLNTFPVKQM